MNSDKLNTALRYHSFRYALAVGAVVLGILLRYGLYLWVGPGLPTYITFYPFVMLVALLGGLGPGLFATVLVVIVADYWLILPYGFGITTFREIVGQGLFSLMGVFISTVAELYRRTRFKAAAYDKEVALRQSEKRWKQLAEAMPQLVWSCTPDGMCDYLSPQWVRYTGISEERQLGYGWMKQVHPDDREPLTAAWDNAVRSSGVFDVEFRIRSYDGAYRWFKTRAVPVRDDAGRIFKWYGSNTDINDLRESQEDLNRAQAVAHTGSWRLNIQRNELLWSEENHRIFGVPEGTPLSYETFLSIVHPEDREYVDQKWMAALRREPYDIEHRIIVDNSVKWVRERATLEFDGTGALLGGFGTTQDITELKHLERALQNRMQELQTIFDSVPAMVFYKDRENRFIRVNKELERAMGKAKHELEGKSLFDLYPAEQAEAYWRDDNEVLASGQPKRGISEVMTTPAGPRLVQTDKVPYIDEAGKISGIIGFALDITELKQAEETLRRSKDDLEQLVQERTAMLNKVNELLREEIAERQKASEEIHDLYNNAPCGYHSLDPDGTFVRINDTELSWLGYSRDEIIGRKKFSDLITASSLKFFKESFPIFKERGFVHDLEFEMIRKDGSILPVLVSATAIRDEQGNYVMSRSSIFDITMRKRAEEAVRKSEERFRSLIHTAPVVIVSLAPDGTILEFNPEAEIAYGRTRAGVLGGNYLDLFILPEQRGMVVDAMKKVLGGEPVSGYENPIRSAGGAKYFYVWNIERVLDDKGNPVAIIAVGHDVTERRQMMEALQNAAAYTRNLIETSVDPLIIINKDAKVTDLNKATEHFLNLKREQIIGTDFSRYFTEPEKAAKGFQHVFKRGFIRDYPLAIKGRFNVVRDVLFNARVYQNQAGETEGVVAAARDITRRKRIEERLRKSEERLKFLSIRLLEVQEHERKSIATELHDSVASSLTAVILGLSRARPAIEACEPRYREIINSSIAMLQNVTDETRQLMNSLRPPMLDDFGLISSIRWFKEQYGSLNPELTTEMEITIEENMIPAQLKIVLFRIIQEAFTNIAKHSRAQTANLYLKQTENRLNLVIADDGAGFDPDAVDSNKELNKGFGIMSMKERAQLSGGNLTIDSDRGQGTVIAASWQV
jgi:PAS domain S-box-containing protein